MLYITLYIGMLYVYYAQFSFNVNWKWIFA